MIDNYTLHGYHKRVHIVTMRIATERRGGFLPTAYAYNLRSWVTHINSPLFSQRLSYGEPSDGGQPRYGGAISGMDWQTIGDSVRSYRYQYDGLGRLTSADYLESGHSSDRYVTEYSYDLMGNILTLSRSGKVYDEIYGVTDDLTYQYDGNRLIRVTNHAADTPAYKDAMYYADGADLDTERTYDANGNMTSNADSRISRISYDALNMPCRIDYIDGSHIDYTYAADGAKQRVDYYLNPYTSSLPDDDLGTACDSSLLVHTWREYAGNCVYVCDTLSMILINGGYITFDYTTHQPIYHYYLKDYLGNNRITVSLADGRIEEVNHYYPFGGLMGDSRNATTQPYKYIGKELDRTHGLDWYDHGARHYDPVTGRWNTMDKMCEKYYGISPYASCGDDPVNAFDPDGNSTWVTQKGENKYEIVGGDINDKDRNIYVGRFNDKGTFIPIHSIGITTSTTSFYDSDADGGGQWSIGSIIDTSDKSGDDFLSRIISENPSMIEDYMRNARNGHKYDFKSTNGTEKAIKGIDIYRGMPIGYNGKGQTIFSSARDIGNMAAGYVAGVNGMPWKASRIAFDTYQNGIEGISTRNAEYYGWVLGYNSTNNNQKMDNLMHSIATSLSALWKLITK